MIFFVFFTWTERENVPLSCCIAISRCCYSCWRIQRYWVWLVWQLVWEKSWRIFRLLLWKTLYSVLSTVSSITRMSCMWAFSAFLFIAIDLTWVRTACPPQDPLDLWCLIMTAAGKQILLVGVFTSGKYGECFCDCALVQGIVDTRPFDHAKKPGACKMEALGALIYFCDKPYQTRRTDDVMVRFEICVNHACERYSFNKFVFLSFFLYFHYFSFLFCFTWTRIYSLKHPWMIFHSFLRTCFLNYCSLYFCFSSFGSIISIISCFPPLIISTLFSAFFFLVTWKRVDSLKHPWMITQIFLKNMILLLFPLFLFFLLWFRYFCLFLLSSFPLFLVFFSLVLFFLLPEKESTPWSTPGW